MKRSPAPEAKVAAAGITGYLIALMIQLLQTFVPHFAIPQTSVALLTTTISAIVAYLAPHTPDSPGPQP